MDSLLSQKQNVLPDVLPSGKAEPVDFSDLTELVSFCPHCKSLETLLFSQGELVSQRKYSQHSGSVYHDCGSDNPCYLMA